MAVWYSCRWQGASNVEVTNNSAVLRFVQCADFEMRRIGQVHRALIKQSVRPYYGELKFELWGTRLSMTMFIGASWFCSLDGRNEQPLAR